MERQEDLINVLLGMTKRNELEWKYKNPKILSDCIPGGNAIVKIFAAKFKANNVYVCIRKYIETHRDPSGEYREDSFKKSILIFDGVELLYMIDSSDYQKPYILDELINEVEKIIDNLQIKNILE